MLLLTAKKLSNYNLRGGASTDQKFMSSENQIENFEHEEEVPPIEVEPINYEEPVKVGDIPSFRDLETSNFSRSNVNIAQRRKKLVEQVLSDKKQSKLLETISQKALENEKKRGVNSLKFSDLLPKNAKKAQAATAFMSLMTFQKCGIIHLKTGKPTQKFDGKFSEIAIYK